MKLIFLEVEHNSFSATQRALLDSGVTQIYNNQVFFDVIIEYFCPLTNSLKSLLGDRKIERHLYEKAQQSVEAQAIIDARNRAYVFQQAQMRAQMNQEKAGGLR